MKRSSPLTLRLCAVPALLIDLAERVDNAAVEWRLKGKGDWHQLVTLQAANDETAAIAVDARTAGSTVDADRYEEGAWWPAITFAGNGSDIVYSPQTAGRYTRVGNLVTAIGMLILAGKGKAAGPAEITGLPYPALNDGMFASATIGHAAGFAGITGAMLVGLVAPGASTISLHQACNGAEAALTGAHFRDGSAIYFTASYRVQ